VFRPMEACL